MVQLEQRTTQQVVIGPIPAPALLADYDKILPGCAERIVKMAEENSRHRREMERTALDTNRALALRGQWFGFGICLLAIGGGIGLAAIGRDIAGLGSVVSALVGLVTLFIVGRARQEAERREKAQAVPTR
jgi:uncharacterized membrane protein